MVLATCCALAFIVPNPTTAQQLTAAQAQYVSALRSRDVAKAKDLAALANLDPNNLGGRAAISLAAEVPGGYAAMPDAVWTYLTRELKQSTNLPFAGQQRSVFSTLCEGAAVAIGGPRDQFDRALARIRQSLAEGASVKDFPNVPPFMRAAQPFLACLQAYRGLPATGTLRADMRGLLAEYLKRGANPNARLFNDDATAMSIAAQMLDVELLKLLVAHGGKVGRAIPAVGNNSLCKLNPPVFNTFLADVPDPNDASSGAALQFLTIAMELGVDIKAAQTRTSPWMGQCRREDRTLKERAIAVGAVRYAKMVAALEDGPPDVPKAPARK